VPSFKRAMSILRTSCSPANESAEVRQAAPKVHETINALDGKYADIFHGHPFYQPPDLAPMLRQLVESQQAFWAGSF
jgi:hypothetical protein